jgi:uncharacterized surface protein with fasciclin (FAS1) repeats
MKMNKTISIKNLLPAMVIAVTLVGTLLISTSANAAPGAKPSGVSIVDIVLADDGEFDVLQAAVIEAGLVGALDGRKQYTVFAPTDAAFGKLFPKLSEAEIIKLIEDGKVPGLTNILLNHVTNGRRISPSVLGAPSYKMLNGDKVLRSELDLNVNAIDISARNGVVHLVNTVLMP